MFWKIIRHNFMNKVCLPGFINVGMNSSCSWGVRVIRPRSRAWMRSRPPKEPITLILYKQREFCQLQSIPENKLYLWDYFEQFPKKFRENSIFIMKQIPLQEQKPINQSTVATYGQTLNGSLKLWNCSKFDAVVQHGVFYSFWKSQCILIPSKFR